MTRTATSLRHGCVCYRLISESVRNFAVMTSLIVIGSTTLVVGVAIVIHSEVIQQLSKLRTWPRPRIVVVLSMFLLFGVHLFEIFLFAVLFFVFNQTETYGSITASKTFIDHYYYSAICYTTLGFGDVLPTGYLRFATGVEAVLGLILITWSASYSFILMRDQFKEPPDKLGQLD